ncbi:MAG TPA: hypothetical protein VK509_18750 [Polyangiales bacterium]|nr:hypothetical protein [Polyangiales bacterium]
MVVTIAALSAGAWLGFTLRPSDVQACRCALPGPRGPTILPAEGSFVPRNTRVWMLHQRPTTPLQAVRLELRAASGTLIDTHVNVVTLGPLPSAEDVVYMPAEPGSSCGPVSSLSVALAADAWIVMRVADAGMERAERLHPDAPGSAIAAMFPDELGGYELHSGPCGGVQPPAKGTMVLGTFDLAGNFSGWSEPLRFEPGIDASPCSVSVVAAGRGGMTFWLLALALALSVRQLRRGVSSPAVRSSSCG